MADQDERTPDMGPEGGGPVTPGRAGRGMGVSMGDYTEAPLSSLGGSGTTATAGEGTEQRRDFSDQHTASPTSKASAGKRSRNAEEGKPE